MFDGELNKIPEGQQNVIIKKIKMIISDSFNTTGRTI